ncbi:MAG: S8 family serine peptidase [Candidatus Levybacteria bacterium]|nr:S8 family serine peptidase [Candidatus Levybacteria bacterium]
MWLKRLSKILTAAILAVGLVFTPFAAQVNSQTPRAPQASSREDVIIGFTKTPGKNEQALVKAHGGEIKYTYNLVPAIAANIPTNAQEALLNNPNVKVIEPDIKVYAVDAELDGTWGVKKIGSGTVHDGGNKGTGVKVGVIDSGIDYTHPDLDANYAGGYDFYNDDADPMDDNGHGTHVSGTIAAEDNDVGVVGVAPEAKVYAYKVLGSNGSGSYSDVIAALEKAVNDGVGITNNSYGSSGDPGITVKAAFDNSAALGILHIAAAGNSGNPPGNGDNVIYPARWDSLVAVAATNSDDKRASWSSTGPAVEISGPGVSIKSTLPGGGYGNYSGTSMASPHVAGTAALVIKAGFDDVRGRMNSTAVDLGSSGRDKHYGYGRVDAAAAASVPGPVDQLPAVSITSPSEGATVSGTILITADASDDNGVVSVDFYIDGVLLSSDTQIPYEANWDTTTAAEGSHVIKAVATDTASQTKSDQVNVVVDNFNDSPVADAGADQTVIDNDGNGTEAVTLDGSGSYDPDGSIVSYDWYEGGIWLGSGATLTVDFALGTHTVTLTVTDNDGASASDDVVITVVEAPDISLTTTGYKVKGLQKADLNWSGANTTNVYVYRDSVLVATTANDGFYTDNINQRGSGTYIYKVCEEGTTTCSNESTVVFN